MRIGSLALMAALPLAGCSAPPTLYMFGSYFPAWMLCGVLGIGAALVARGAFVATGLTETIPHQLLVCAAIGTVVALLVWLLVFR